MTRIEEVLGAPLRAFESRVISDISEMETPGTVPAPERGDAILAFHATGGPSGNVVIWMQIRIDDLVFGGDGSGERWANPFALYYAPAAGPTRAPLAGGVSEVPYVTGDGRLWVPDPTNGVWRRSDNWSVTAP